MGREIEKGGVYKGIVTSIKEYGAFVEFNGGQQGLLHISELAHNPVCESFSPFGVLRLSYSTEFFLLILGNIFICQVSKVSDVVSVGQVLNLMCIGLDVRGNINLSLKATLPKTSTTLGQQTPKVWKRSSNPESEQENKDNQPAEAVESLASIVIRSAAECDEADKSSALNQPTKGNNSFHFGKKFPMLTLETLIIT